MSTEYANDRAKAVDNCSGEPVGCTFGVSAYEDDFSSSLIRSMASVACDRLFFLAVN